MMDLSRSPTSVSDEGRHARERGDPASANPYGKGTEEHETWARGYAMPDATGEEQAVEDEDAATG